MSEVHAVPDGIRSYGHTSGEVASRIFNEGVYDLQANITTLTPVFGAIGIDFLSAFGAAQTNHSKAVLELAGHYAATATAANDTAASYEGTDNRSAAALGAVGNGIEARP
ncbi:type VII secretion target [Antrihabitans cavernicola]|uniref:ESX-1 secretion-associated protein n=1 Tax=Antrihabitans cavernicola TaxID=2495913 RepID=A0A5A7SD52_9NOCA|nr:type VII secretion target [Spelaeibacter cavernicola]KAA0023484.1 ESX-1 secretion-associated protein [Spelaeibacter cavernicola]